MLSHHSRGTGIIRVGLVCLVDSGWFGSVPQSSMDTSQGSPPKRVESSKQFSKSDAGA